MDIRWPFKAQISHRIVQNQVFNRSPFIADAISTSSLQVTVRRHVNKKIFTRFG